MTGMIANDNENDYSDVIEYRPKSIRRLAIILALGIFGSAACFIQLWRIWVYEHHLEVSVYIPQGGAHEANLRDARDALRRFLEKDGKHGGYFVDVPYYVDGRYFFQRKLAKSGGDFFEEHGYYVDIGLGRVERVRGERMLRVVGISRSP